MINTASATPISGIPNAKRPDTILLAETDQLVYHTTGIINGASWNNTSTDKPAM
jgi:hypothetical protein